MRCSVLTLRRSVSYVVRDGLGVIEYLTDTEGRAGSDIHDKPGMEKEEEKERLQPSVYVKPEEVGWIQGHRRGCP